jgi:endonuclease G
LTRRTDPTWGDPEESKRANIDTFHFTNCSPQHFRFNQSAKFWQGAERYVLENGVLDQETQRRIVVFQGPVFDEVNDLYIDETQIIPSQYWKVIVWKGQRGVRAVGLLLSQRELLDEQRRYLGKPTDLKAVEVNQWRVPIRRIQKETGLQFDDKILANDTFNLQDQPHVGEASQAAALRSKEDLKYGL